MTQHQFGQEETLTSYDCVDNVGIIIPAVELDPHTAPALSEALDYGIDDTEATKLCVDFTDTTYIDSSGLFIMLKAYKRANEVDKTIVLRNPGRSVMNLLDMTGIVDIFEIETVE